jgi:hypothetical protein
LRQEQEHEAGNSNETGRKPFPPFHAATPCTCTCGKSPGSTILLGPACLPSLFPLTPRFGTCSSLYIFNPHPTPSNLSVHLFTRPFFVFEKQSVKMGYTKTDELAINTIRVLAVSQSLFKPSNPATETHSNGQICPSIAVVAAAVDSLLYHQTPPKTPEPRLKMINCAHKSSF